MKRVWLVLAVAGLWAFAPGPAHALSQGDEPTGDAHAMPLAATLGATSLFFDQDQFNREIETLDLPALPFPLGFEFGLVSDHGDGPHFLRIGMVSGATNQVSHSGGRYGSLSLAFGNFALGWRYQFSRVFGFHADVGLAWGGWQYILIADEFSGQAGGSLLGIAPRGGLLLRLGRDLWLNAYGGYASYARTGDELYSGDMRRGDFDDLTFDHASAGLALVFVVGR